MTTPSIAAPRLPWDPANPFPFYARRRREGDVVWDETARTWLVLGHHAAQQVLSGSGWTNDPLANAKARPTLKSIAADVIKRSILFTEGADHLRLRRAVHDVFTPTFISGLTTGVEAIAAAVIGHPLTGRAFDFMTDIALPLPLAVVGEWLGLDVDSSRLLGKQSHAILRLLVPLSTPEEEAAGAAASAALATRILPLAADRRSNPGDDLMSYLASDPDLSLDDVVITAIHIAVAGHETTADLLGSAVIRLLNPNANGARLVDELDVDDPSLITELLRLDGPVQATARTATKAERIGKADIAAGQQVVVVVAAANRDPAVFDEPDELRLGRRGPAPLAFGHGEHHCLGAALARLEAAVALRQILARKPTLVGQATWRGSPAIRGPRHFSVIFEAA